MISFKTPEHEDRFITAMQRMRKIYNGKFDPEYAAALYVLSADVSTWNKAQEYITGDGIDIPLLLEEEDFSGGYSVLILLAGNLFNNQVHIDPVELMRLDENNFQIALGAILLRRNGYSIQ